MKPESENIEEKLIPYLEGVLNPKERREVEEAINTNPELAREMSELRELILELREGFATGLKPPQEELSIEEVVELSYHTGSTDKLPGSSAQKARLFCSDSGLEEYSLLRALSEEMARTTLDRDNVPELPAYLRKEFSSLKGEVNGKGKVLPFLKPSFASKTSSVSLWRRASGWLDRIDPKPLMASAAALVMLSLGVHLYNRPASTPASSHAEVASAVAQPTIEPGTIAQGMGAAAPSPSSPGIEGVAVFTSDDRGLLKEQAEKLLAKKVRYTVTKDRILVAEKDVAVARDILWEEAEGKAVAMAKEEPEPRRMARTVSSAQSAPAEPDDSGSSQSQAPSAVSYGDYASSAGEGSVTVYRPAKRGDAPAPVQPKRPPGVGERRGDRGVLPGYSDGASSRKPGDELREGLGKGRVESRPEPESVPPPSEVILPATPSEVALPTQIERPVKASESRPPISEARRQKLKDLAVGDAAPEGDVYQYQTTRNEAAGGAPVAEESAPAAASSMQQQKTTVETRARVSQPSPPITASAPAVTKVDHEVDEVDSRLARVQASRQKVAEKNGVELSFERQDGKIVVYVRPNRSLDKAQLDELRKVLRKELGLAESDTLIFR